MHLRNTQIRCVGVGSGKKACIAGALAALTLAAPTSARAYTPSVSATVYVGQHFEVRDHEAPVKYVFNGVTRVASVVGSLSNNSRLQRIRLFAGWNLCSLAVNGPLAAASGQTLTNLVSEVFEWEPAGQDWLVGEANRSLPRGAVLWIQARTNTLVTALGSYTDPSAQAVAPGGAYLPGMGLEAWSPELGSGLSAWLYDSQAGQWKEAFGGELSPFSDLFTTVAPGNAFFVNSGLFTTLAPPTPGLRIRYYHQDHLGSSAVMTDASGKLIEEESYCPFGQPRETYLSQTIADPYQFIQKERDSESDLQYFEARFLAGNLGRFTRVDPLAGKLKEAWLQNPQRLNLYAYAQNQPILYVDPSGFDRFDGQDPELQKVMNESFAAGKFSCSNGDSARECVDRFSSRDYAALTSVYDRMKERGLWKYVEYVTGTETAGELSLSFTVSDPSGFKDALAGVRRTGPFDYSYGARSFSQDENIWNLFHSGSQSVRQLSETDSLHISIYNSGRITAHIDANSPVETETGFYTSMNPTRGLIHQGREAGGPLVGDAVLGFFGVPKSFTLDPGLQFFPEQLPSMGPPANIYAAFTKHF